MLLLKGLWTVWHSQWRCRGTSKSTFSEMHSTKLPRVLGVHSFRCIWMPPECLLGALVQFLVVSQVSFGCISDDSWVQYPPRSTAPASQMLLSCPQGASWIQVQVSDSSSSQMGSSSSNSNHCQPNQDKPNQVFSHTKQLRRTTLNATNKLQLKRHHISSPQAKHSKMPQHDSVQITSNNAE